MREICITLTICLFAVYSFAQNNVGIGTNTTHPSALLDLTTTDKGILVPGLTITQSHQQPDFYYC